MKGLSVCILTFLSLTTLYAQVSEERNQWMQCTQWQQVYPVQVDAKEYTTKSETVHFDNFEMSAEFAPAYDMGFMGYWQWVNADEIICAFMTHLEGEFKEYPGYYYRGRWHIRWGGEELVLMPQEDIPEVEVISLAKDYEAPDIGEVRSMLENSTWLIVRTSSKSYEAPTDYHGENQSQIHFSEDGEFIYNSQLPSLPNSEKYSWSVKSENDLQYLTVFSGDESKYYQQFAIFRITSSNFVLFDIGTELTYFYNKVN